MLGTKGDDGVFRYEPPADDTADTARSRPGDIDDDVADWFEGTSAQEVSAAVAKVEREAAVTIADQEAARLARYRGEVAPPERPAISTAKQAEQDDGPPQQGGAPAGMPPASPYQQPPGQHGSGKR